MDNQACMCIQDYAYASPYPRQTCININKTKNKIKIGKERQKIKRKLERIP